MLVIENIAASTDDSVLVSLVCIQMFRAGGMQTDESTTGRDAISIRQLFVYTVFPG